ncbi:DNA adenine methylase [Nocardioides sp. 1609]|uniref:DNA adenine methylase n=1 Tax=Nocardioides sp. 1609 TaxID=2508327 RepID=UPI00106FCAC0|nr:DNA adenine methylase [Nocardioides sp. 1609]
MTYDADTRLRLEPWRPVQFLGSKLRSLDRIAAAITTTTGTEPQTVWEPFTGSSVVAQRLAGDGHTMWSCDAMASSVQFASALLGCGRNAGTASVTQVVKDVRQAAHLDAPSPWDPWLAGEQSALANRDGFSLLRENTQLPQRWKSIEADSPLAGLFATVDTAATDGQVLAEGLLSSTYAGTYFGLTQAVHLERLRGAIDIVTPASSRASAWQRSVLLTALCHAASAAVFSAGKHFAQPHRIREGKDLAFHARRALSDRSVDVVSTFDAAVKSIDRVAASMTEHHDATQTRVENVTAETLKDRHVTAVYADPPYTSQQYSRFYHVPEVMVAGVPADLQHARGSVTRGLYPTDRYRSPFSSRTQAPGAFAHLANTCASAGAQLYVSYSGTRSAETGNARVVSMPDLVSIIGDAYGQPNVTIHELDLRYRQFNHTTSGMSGRDDPEYLIIGRDHAR